MSGSEPVKFIRVMFADSLGRVRLGYVARVPEDGGDDPGRGGLTAWVIADQLGPSKPSMIQDVYLGRKVVSPATAAALEGAAVKARSRVSGW